MSRYPQVPVAFFHTHGAFDAQYGLGNYLFSLADRSLSNSTGKSNYMADPSSNAHRYDPNSKSAKGKDMGSCNNRK
jgi:hypothetical protein